MAQYSYSGPEFSFTGGVLNQSAHMVVRVTENGVTTKWRACLTMNADGTWQWAPGAAAALVVSSAVEDQITAAVAAAVAQYGVAIPE